MDSTDDARVCTRCRVITVTYGGAWVHEPWVQEKFARAVCENPEPGRPAKAREVRYGRGDTHRQDKFSVQSQVDGVVVPPGEAVALAVNGSYKVQHSDWPFDGVSWGYLATNGMYGVGTTVLPTRLLGTKPGVQAELRALWRGLRRLLPERPVLIVTNSTDVVELLQRWKAGSRPMPAGYDPREGAAGRQGRASLVALADLVQENAASLDELWVRAGSGMALNEAAHSLARIARAWASDRLTKDAVVCDARQIACRTLSAYGATP